MSREPEPETSTVRINGAYYTRHNRTGTLIPIKFKHANGHEAPSTTSTKKEAKKMCKQMIIPYIPADTSPKTLWKFAGAAQKELQPGQNDGFGMAALSPEGRIGIAKWLHADQAFKDPAPAHVSHALERYAKVLEPRHMVKGMAEGEWLIDEPVSALMLHARFATSGRGLENTHPHMDTPDLESSDVVLIHNGVLRNTLPSHATTSCDSEYIAHAYMEYGAVHNPANIGQVTDVLEGYFAVGAFVRTVDGWMVDIFKDRQAMLSCAYIDALGCAVFATTKDVIEKACEECKFRKPTVYDFKDNSFVRTNPITGDVLDVQEDLPTYTHIYQQPNQLPSAYEPKTEPESANSIAARSWKIPGEDSESADDAMIRHSLGRLPTYGE